MTGFDMCKGGALPGKPTNSKDAFCELENSEPGFRGVRRLGRFRNIAGSAKYALLWFWLVHPETLLQKSSMPIT